MSGSSTIRRVSNISYKEFREQHLLPNQPIMIGSDLIQNWSCLRHWRSPSESTSLNAPVYSTAVETKGVYTPITEHTPVQKHAPKGHSNPNMTYLKDRYGQFTVPVDEGGCRSERPLKEVIELWESGQGEGMYVKDWHLALQLERQGSLSTDREEEFYVFPDVFRDDWMNRYYLKETQDDFRFVYMGESGTCTKLHRDVYTSYSWSTNIVGRKRWWLFPPQVTGYITKPNGDTIGDEQALPSFEDPEFIPDEGIWPGWENARREMIVVEQEEGETIFVPSGWYHQVLNLTFCISINHNWSNAHNMQSMHRSMVDAVTRVEESISDVKELLKKQHPDGGWEDEWMAVVQDLLKHDSGWDWMTFLRMIELNLEDCLEARPTKGQDMTSESKQVSSDSIPTIDLKPLEQSVTYTSSLTGSIRPDKGYVIDQITPCITHFMTTEWGKYHQYRQIVLHIQELLCQ